MGLSTAPSILNDITGPVMRGPSSSHTAGSYHIATLARALLDARPVAARFIFDPAGSYAQVYRQQGVDRAFAMGLIDRPLTDLTFFHALETAAAQGVAITFAVQPLAGADHPNAVEIELEGTGGETLSLRAKSVGGGAVEVTRVNGWAVRMNGQAHHVLVETDPAAVQAVLDGLREHDQTPGEARRRPGESRVLLEVERREPLEPAAAAAILGIPGVRRVLQARPVGYGRKGKGLFSSGKGMVALAEERGLSLGRLGLAYEAELLGAPEAELLAEMTRRFEIMRAAVHEGLSDGAPATQLLLPSAGRIMRADAEGRLAIGGLHTRAAARAMAVMHVNGAMGVVCAAPKIGRASCRERV